MSNLASCPGAKRQTGAGARASGRHGPRRLAVFLFVAGATALAACQFDPAGLGGPGDPDRPDANPSVPDANPIDGNPDVNCGWPFAPRHFDPCALDNPVTLAPLVLDDDGTYVYNTNTGLLTNPAGIDLVPAPPSSLEQGGEVRALWVDGLDLQDGSTLRVKGARPLMIVSTDEIRVRGVLDLSSTFDSVTLTFDPGAGADPPSDECSSKGVQFGGSCREGGGGGGGAGFGGDGADGGRGAGTAICAGSATGIAGGTGGNAVLAPTTIRGGCKGERGGNGDIDMLYGLGGVGGGAVHLVSQVRVDIEGTIQAGGAAGTGAENNRSGGGGAGSGGLIGLESPDIEIDAGAILAANGGAGGGGCNNGRAGDGEDGKALALAAVGGTGQSSGGSGGNGSAGNALGQPGTNAARGGGGGGGGAGFIITYQSTPTPSAQAVISPVLTQR
jgi:hypothetical protein